MSLKRELLDTRDRLSQAVDDRDEIAAREIDAELALDGWSIADVDTFAAKYGVDMDIWREPVER